MFCIITKISAVQTGIVFERVYVERTLMDTTL